MGSAATFATFLVTLLAVVTTGSIIRPVKSLRRGADLSPHGDLTGRLLARFRRQDTSEDAVIPLDKQMKCGQWAICDSRTQFCDDVVFSCSSCAGDVCNPVRYGVAGAERDCQLYCPEYWAKQQETTTTAPTTTTTLAPLNAVQNQDIAEIKEMLTQYTSFTIIVTIMAGLVLFLSVMAVFLAVKLYTKTPSYGPLAQQDPESASEKDVRNTDDGPRSQQKMKQASFSSLTTGANNSTLSTSLDSDCGDVNVSPSYAAKPSEAGGATSAKANAASQYSDPTSSAAEHGRHVLAQGGEPVSDPKKLDGVYNPTEDTEVKGQHSSSASSSSSFQSPSYSAAVTGLSLADQPPSGDEHLSEPPQCHLDERTRERVV